MNALGTRNLNAAVLDGLADAYRNWDDTCRDHALSRMGANQPAFWYSASSTNSVVGPLCTYANQFGSIEEAQERLTDELSHTGRNYRSWEWLDRLIPLNTAAVRDLTEAYTRAATFRDTITIGVPVSDSTEVWLPAARVMAPTLLDAVRAVEVA